MPKQKKFLGKNIEKISTFHKKSQPNKLKVSKNNFNLLEKDMNNRAILNKLEATILKTFFKKTKAHSKKKPNRANSKIHNLLSKNKVKDINKTKTSSTKNKFKSLFQMKMKEK